jgi:hypothetical protein
MTVLSGERRDNRRNEPLVRVGKKEANKNSERISLSTSET